MVVFSLILNEESILEHLKERYGEPTSREYGRPIWTLCSGRYTVQATSFAPGSVGAYTLSLTSGASSPVDGVVAHRARELSVGEQVGGALAEGWRGQLSSRPAHPLARPAHAGGRPRSSCCLVAS